MKKWIALVTAAVLLVVVCTACGTTEKVTAEVINIPLTSEEYAFAVNPNNQELLEKVNAFLAEIKSNGKFDEVCNHYFGNGEPVEVTSAAEDSTKDQLIVVTHPGFEPFEYTKGNKFLGIDMEMAQLLADYLQKELVIRTIEFDSIFDTLNTNGADLGMAGITVNEKRKALVNFSDSYYNASQNIIVPSNNNKFAECKTLEDVTNVLNGFDGNVRIGVQNGTTGNLYVTGSADFGFDGLKAKAVGFKDGSLAVTAMLNGDVDYVIIDEAPALAITKAINAMQ